MGKRTVGKIILAVFIASLLVTIGSAIASIWLHSEEWKNTSFLFWLLTGAQILPAFWAAVYAQA